MEDCIVFLEKTFFERNYLQLDFGNVSEEESTRFASDTRIEMSIYPIHVLDFYAIRGVTKTFILFILILSGLILLYILFSKIYLKKIIKRLNKDALDEYGKIE